MVTSSASFFSEFKSKLSLWKQYHLYRQNNLHPAVFARVVNVSFRWSPSIWTKKRSLRINIARSVANLWAEGNTAVVRNFPIALCPVDEFPIRS
jgi:hypothetical protein